MRNSSIKFIGASIFNVEKKQINKQKLVATFSCNFTEKFVQIFSVKLPNESESTELI